MPAPTPQQLERNVRLYPTYTALFNAFAWMPVFFLYFSEHLSLERVLQLEAIYYAAVVLLEVPSGYFSDRVGRKATLFISSIGLAVAYALFVVGAGFAGLAGFGVFVAAQICLAAGIAFNSGTDTSFHFDSLKGLGKNREAEYEDREAIAARNGFIAGAIAALVGGAVGVIELQLAYVISLLAAVVSVGVVMTFSEPHPHGHVINEAGEEVCVDETPGILRQMLLCFGFLKQRSLAWLFAFAVLMLILNHVPYEFYQPYIKVVVADGAAAVSGAANGSVDGAMNGGVKLAAEPGIADVASEGQRDQWAPLIAGVHMFISMLLASKAAAMSASLRKRLGTASALLLAAALQTVIIATMAYFVQWWVVPLILLRVMPRGLMTAPLNAAIAPRVPQAQRATYLSIQSLVGKMSFSLTLVSLSLLVAGDVEANALTLTEMLRWCTLIAVIGIAALACTAWCVKPATGEKV